MQARAACPQKNIKQPDFIQRNPHRKSISTPQKTYLVDIGGLFGFLLLFFFFFFLILTTIG